MLRNRGLGVLELVDFLRVMNWTRPCSSVSQSASSYPAPAPKLAPATWQPASAPRHAPAPHARTAARLETSIEDARDHSAAAPSLSLCCHLQASAQTEPPPLRRFSPHLEQRPSIPSGDRHPSRSSPSSVQPLHALSLTSPATPLPVRHCRRHSAHVGSSPLSLSVPTTPTIGFALASWYWCARRRGLFLTGTPGHAGALLRLDPSLCVGPRVRRWRRWGGLRVKRQDLCVISSEILRAYPRKRFFFSCYCFPIYCCNL